MTTAMITLLALLAAPQAQASETPVPAPNKAASDRLEKKVNGILAKSKLPAAKRGGPVTLTQEEIESFFALSKMPKIPGGVSGIHFEIHPGKQVAYATIDFDKYRAAGTAAKRPSNPLVDLFLHGQRVLKTEGKIASPSVGMGTYHLDYVSLDAFTAQTGMLQFLLKWFVLPRYPKAEMDKPFQLPTNIRRVEVGEGKIVVYP